MLEATRALSRLEEVASDVEDLQNFACYNEKLAREALYYMTMAVETVRTLSHKERGIIR